MGTYLQDNPPRIQQYRCPRRRTPSGIIGVHTAESIADETGPDTGAENVARFIRDRTNYGSYHWLADSDSIIQLIPHSCVAYHIATHSLNEHTIGISAACQAAKWNSLDDDYVDAMVRNMARCAADAARWLKREHNVTVPAWRITLAQALDGQRGFLAHGDADPDRRTDPGKTFPWSQFLTDYEAEMNGDDDMPLNSDDLAKIRKVVQDELARSYTHDGPPKTTVSTRHGGRYGFLASTRAGQASAKVDAVLDAVKAMPGVDGDALAAKVAEAVERLDAETVAGQLQVTVRPEELPAP